MLWRAFWSRAIYRDIGPMHILFFFMSWMYWGGIWAVIQESLLYCEWRDGLWPTTRCAHNTTPPLLNCNWEPFRIRSQAGIFVGLCDTLNAWGRRDRNCRRRLLPHMHLLLRSPGQHKEQRSRSSHCFWGQMWTFIRCYYVSRMWNHAWCFLQ